MDHIYKEKIHHGLFQQVKKIVHLNLGKIGNFLRIILLTCIVADNKYGTVLILFFKIYKCIKELLLETKPTHTFPLHYIL